MRSVDQVKRLKELETENVWTRFRNSAFPVDSGAQSYERRPSKAVPAQKSIRSRNLFAGNVARPGFLPGQGRIATQSLRRFSRSDYRLLAGGVLDDGRGTGPPNPLGVPMPVVVRAGW